MFDKLYGKSHNRKLLASILDGLGDDFRKLEALVSAEDRRLLQ